MIELNVPGRGAFTLKHLVMDVNGTIAIDGILIDGLVRQISQLGDRLIIHLLTANTHGKQETIDRQLNLTAVQIAPGNESTQKADYVRKLGPEKVVAIGQGANDTAMLKSAALGICVLSQEGSAVEALLAADIVVPDIFVAFELLDKPVRITASLRK
jgi:P-type E1-E2 ATPase